jgi:ribose transport system permease protein
MKWIGLILLLLVYFGVALFAAGGERWGHDHFDVAQRVGLAAAFSVAAGILLAVTGRVDNKLLGITIFLLILHCCILVATDPQRWESNHFNLGKRIGIDGILALGAGMLIITGGVDLSIGSVLGLCACTFCFVTLKAQADMPLGSALALATCLTALLGALVGLFNGILVTNVRVQAFVVTLCGLFLFRGAARYISEDQVPRIGASVGELNVFFRGDFLGVSLYLWLLLVLFAITSVFLHLTIFGRYFYAIGSNERAAHYSGINTHFYKILAYVLCSTFAAIGALVYVVHDISVTPSQTGNFRELYAIAGAVVGGCSLRGGEGTTIGMVIGAAILVLLPNLTGMLGIRSELEPTVIGGALLLCAIMDELLRRGWTWRELVALLRFWRVFTRFRIRSQ